MKSLGQTVQRINKARNTERRLYAMGSRLLARSIAMMLLISIICLLGLEPISESRFTFNQYVPVDNNGVPIQAIRGDVEHMTEEEVAEWVTTCARKALTFSPSSYQKNFMEFAQRCLPSTGVSSWGQQLKRAGYLEMIQQESILEFNPETTELIYNRVINGRRYWRFRVDGQLIRYFNQTYRTPLSLDIVVARQDPFNFEYAISISRIVL